LHEAVAGGGRVTDGERAVRVVEDGGRRAAIVRLATRALKALRAALVPLRPRCARLAALTALAASRVLATIDGRRSRA
jgi:hypothetical protein